MRRSSRTPRSDAGRELARLLEPPRASTMTGLGVPVTAAGPCSSGDAGIGLSIVGTTRAAAAVRHRGPTSSCDGVAPRDALQPGRPDAGGVLLLRTRCRAPDVVRDAAPSDVRRGRRRVGAQRHEDLGDRTAGSRTSWSSPPSLTPTCAPAERRASWSPPGTEGLSQGQPFLEHGIRLASTRQQDRPTGTCRSSCTITGRDRPNRSRSTTRRRHAPVLTPPESTLSNGLACPNGAARASRRRSRGRRCPGRPHQ